MAENRILVEGMFPSTSTLPVSGTVSTVPTGTQTVSGTVNSVPAAPTGALFYVHSLDSVPGVALANNFMSVFNPVGSGKSIIFYQYIIIPWATAATTTINTMQLFRVSAASGGTQIAAANVHKFVTAQANSIAEVRVSNPTVTTVNTPLVGIPPVITTAGAGAGAGANNSAPSGASFVCAPGEGLVMRCPVVGDIDQLWNLTFVWAEL